ncbi:16S rRNA (guanine(527)-N(7))-methyltransferase RsmG [Helicobacter equorum]|uniref:16S rRNA (guanine(527)-N(7))-methyltransferase RsmG n=1 Tax=Helicobacter equorum TaxID=361872 RepID=UPI000CF09221|nr:16S rRNA (guanine(527)-N(7))-methyltransferase RsmG [Helicobacter equorum]
MNDVLEYCKSIGIILHDEVAAKLEIYARELLEWNKIHNLSGASTLDSLKENIIDSLYPLRFVDEFASCLDIGSGGGFPAIVLAIALPKARFILTEPRAKRFAFLQYIIAQLTLSNTRVFATRIQEIPITEVNNIDLITSRAVMSVEEIMHYGRKFLSYNGHYLLFKGSNFKKELSYMSVEECFSRNERIYFYRKG